MRIGLVSDSHDNVPLVEVAAALFRAERVDLVLHLGDVMEPETLAPFAGLPLVAVRGNNDEAGRWPDTWRATFAGIDVFAAHGHVATHLTRAMGDAGVVAHGHTHRRRCEWVEGSLVINPGALHRTPTKSVAILELPSREVRFFEITLEGARVLAPR